MVAVIVVAAIPAIVITIIAIVVVNLPAASVRCGQGAQQRAADTANQSAAKGIV